MSRDGRRTDAAQFRGRQAVIKVMLADDHPLFRHGVKSLIDLQDDMKVVAEAADGEAAVAKTLEHSPDVLVLDLRMPGLSGVEAAAEIKSARPDVAIVVLTSFDDESEILRCAELGVKGYLLKHAPPEELLEAIRAVQREESIIDRQAAAHLISAISSASHKRDVPELTQRECEIMREVVAGRDNPSIGARLQISEQTVRTHLGNIYCKLGVSNRTDAVLKALRMGLVEVER